MTAISANEADERVDDDVRCHDHNLIAALKDGRTISAPLTWYPRLRDATPEQRANRRSCAAGYGIHWPDIDEHLSTDGLLRGVGGGGVMRGNWGDVCESFDRRKGERCGGG